LTSAAAIRLASTKPEFLDSLESINEENENYAMHNFLAGT
jgi:hypothetical protein